MEVSSIKCRSARSLESLEDLEPLAHTSLAQQSLKSGREPPPPANPAPDQEPWDHLHHPFPASWKAAEWPWKQDKTMHAEWSVSLTIIILFILRYWQSLSPKADLCRLITHTSPFPGASSGKEPAWQCRRLKRLWSNPWVGKIPWRRG